MSGLSVIMAVAGVLLVLGLALLARMLWRWRRIRRLDWPRARSVVQFAQFTVSYLESQGWTVDVNVDMLNARKGPRIANIHCRAAGQKVRPVTINDIAGRRGVLQLLLVDADPEPAAQEMAKLAGVPVLRPADLAGLEELIVAHGKRMRGPDSPSRQGRRRGSPAQGA